MRLYMTTKTFADVEALSGILKDGKKVGRATNWSVKVGVHLQGTTTTTTTKPKTTTTSKLTTTVSELKTSKSGNLCNFHVLCLLLDIVLTSPTCYGERSV